MFPDGRLWEEAIVEDGHPLNDCFVTLLVINDDLSFSLIGTAFIVEADGHKAMAITAAHCFEEARRILHPNSAFHPSALFLPIPDAVDLEKVRAFYSKGDQGHFCSLKLAAWDSDSDLAVLDLVAEDGSDDLFDSALTATDKIPSEGDAVVIIGYGEMSSESSSDPEKDHAISTLNRRLITRVGTVKEVFPERHLLLKAPCLQTTISVFFGMSGGAVARWTGEDTQIEPFGLLSHALEPQPEYDRFKSGDSIVSLLNCTVIEHEDGKRRFQMTLRNIGVGKNQS
jgi:Trypsin-like peptidase domain